MKRHIKTISLITGLGMLIVTSCTKNFEEVNTNPNNPDQAPMTNVLGYIIMNLSGRFGQTEMDYPAHFVGHVTKGNYTDVSNLLGPPSSSIWSGSYLYVSANANLIIKEAEEEGNANMKAAAMVIKAYAMQMVTDVYGPCPYFDAGKGSEGLIYPSFDSEEDIYRDLMAQLDAANALFNEDIAVGGILGDGDILYMENIVQWKKFCNSLHLRMAIRLAEVDEELASDEIARILGDPATYPVFEGNSDNAAVKYPGTEEWMDPWTGYHSSIGDEKMARPLVDSMNVYADPRLAYYADTIPGGLYVGLTVGEQSEGNHSESNLGPLFIDNPSASTFFMKYAETELIRSEAIARGFISGDATVAYENAVTASCKEYGIVDSLITEYLAGPKVTWDGNLEKIYLQKWISLFHQSWEAWAEMRRTDIPTLGPPANASASGHNRTAFRFPYPASEAATNNRNIPEDVLEEDFYWGYKVWWDVREGVQ